MTWRRRLLYLLRLVPMVEKNYNLIELGPKETGKSFVFREISPYAILLSGGQGSVADLFGWKGRKDKPGLVVRYDVVAFDEVAGPNFKSETDKQMYKGYMEQGSFSRGDDKGTTPAEAGIVFNGNIEGDIPSIARTTHLLTPLPENIRNDDAFHDRWHAYLPGWEVAKLVPEHFTSPPRVHRRLHRRDLPQPAAPAELHRRLRSVLRVRQPRRPARPQGGRANDFRSAEADPPRRQMHPGGDGRVHPVRPGDAAPGQGAAQADQSAGIPQGQPVVHRQGVRRRVLRGVQGDRRHAADPRRPLATG